jgi:hypothetical protein
MMDKDKLRKADIFSGGFFFLFGLWIISQALKMPMKGSWGGVQNVWFVSPAIFPLLVGSMISFLGVLLIRTAFKVVGKEGIRITLRWLVSRNLIIYLTGHTTLRFYAIVVLFLSFVFMNIPRIDFFLCSILFLVVFISMFYFDDDALLIKLFFFYLAGTGLFLIYFALGLPAQLATVVPYPNDWFALVFIVAYLTYAWMLIRNTLSLRKKYRTSLILALVTPFLIGSIFKYFLLVPMPKEGLIVTVMDAIWYFDF